MDQEAWLTVRDVLDKGYNLSFPVMREKENTKTQKPYKLKQACK